MNRGLAWGLAATVALSAWALVSGPRSKGAQERDAVVLPVARPEAGARQTASGLNQEAGTQAAWPEPEMEPAARSPFAPPSRPSSTPLVPAPALTTPPPVPQPSANYRFWGRMSSPDQRSHLYLAKGKDGVPVAVLAATRLEDGWSVDSISDNTIVLANAATQQRTTIFVPPPNAADR